MTPVLGSVSLSLAAGLGILSIILLLFYTRSGNYRLFLVGRRMAIIVSVLVIIATLVLVKELITSNFDIDYVAHHTSIETPTIYKFTALWAGQSGSLLFWVFILSIYSLITIFQNRNRYHRMMPWVLCVILTAVSYTHLTLPTKA